MRKVSYSLLFLIITFRFYATQAQVLSISPGTDLVIKEGTGFFVDSLTLTPSADFTLTDVTLGRSSALSHAATNPHIARVFKFSTSTNVFAGTLQINYQDGAELNGLSETDLELNVHNGVTWQAFASATNNTVDNYVLSTPVSGKALQ